MNTRESDQAEPVDVVGIMREHWFGRELAGPDEAQVIEHVRAGADVALRTAIRVLTSWRPTSIETEPPVILQAQETLRQAAGVAGRLDGVVRVALMGRTQAGKSTVFEYLTGGDGSRIGEGAQRTTREILERPTHHIPGCAVVDTPGVGAKDGDEDRIKAFEAMLSCDLVLWVAANDSTQEETARALQVIADIGKPIIVAMNCRESVSGRARRKRFLRQPTLVFRDLGGHWARLRAYLEPLGITPVAECDVHARAAFDGDRDSVPELVAASRMDILISALEREITQRGSQRRVLNLIDNARGAIVEVEAEFRAASGRLAESADVGQREADEFKARLGRVINDKLIEGKSRINDLIDRRRSWHVSADLTGDVAGDWAGETKLLHSELEQQLEELDGELRGLFEDEVEAFVEDWTLPQSDHTAHVAQQDVSAAANRAAKLAARVGPTVVGVVAIAIASNPVGWTIAGVSTAVGLVLNKYALPSGGWIDRLVPSRRERMNVFRSELSRQTRQELDELAEQVAAHWHERADEYVRMAEAGANDMGSRAADDASLSVRLATHAPDLSCLAMDLDARLTRAVLQLEGRHRLAEGVSVVHRLPGRASAVGTANGTNVEFCLFPPGMAPELLASFADATDRAPVFRAADVISGFLTPPVVTRCTGPGLDFVGEHLRGPLPKELVEKLASAASGTEVRVTVRGGSNGGSDEERAPCPSAACPGA